MTHESPFQGLLPHWPDSLSLAQTGQAVNTLVDLEEKHAAEHILDWQGDCSDCQGEV